MSNGFRWLVAAAVLGLAVPPAPASAQTWNATLEGSQEVPPNASPGFGTARVTINGNVMRVQAMFADLIGTTIAAHIHCCAPVGGNAGVATTLPSFPGFPLGVTEGVYDHIFDMAVASTYSAAFLTANGDDPLLARAALITAMNEGRTYFNVHTTSFPPGEIRGQLQVVPEPATMLLLGTGLLGLGVLRRRARRRT